MKKAVSFIAMFLLFSALIAQTDVKNRIYEVWDDQPAPNRGKDYSQVQARGYPADPDWEAHSYPIGNGYMGANIFGRTDTERIQITDKTLTNGAPYGSGGMTNFAEIFLRFDHYDVNNYKRSLNLNEGISHLSYEHKGVRYTREYFASYPNNVIAIKLTASEREKHFGRYLLIASSREGTLPSGLQGVWSQYHVTPWSGGYWHNINVQMNYWGAFSTNLPETFLAYEEYFNAYLPKAYENGREYVKKWHPDVMSNKDKGNGWCIGTGANAYYIGSPGGHSGPGTGGFTIKLFQDRFEFTQDTVFLRETAYPALLGMSTFLSKTLLPSEDGKLLVDRSASPEQRHKGEYYMTKGTTFDQGFVWETYNDLLKSAKILEINDPFLETVSDQINKLDPILIGESGQVKEYLKKFLTTISQMTFRLKGHVNLIDNIIMGVQSVFDIWEVKHIPKYIGPTEIIAFGDNIKPADLKKLYLYYTTQ